MKRIGLFAAALLAAASMAPAQVVINEYYYDPAGTDSAEFIELYNTTGSPVDISGWTVLLVNGAGTAAAAAYSTITIPASTTLAANDYYVIANNATFGATYPGVVDQSFVLDNILQNGAPDAIVLKNGTTRIDSVNYEADGTFAAVADQADAIAEGGTGRTVSQLVSAAKNPTSGRLPNGVDTGSNLLDFTNMQATPGAANIAGGLSASPLTLPYTESFNDVATSHFLPGFVALRAVDPTTAGKPGVASPDGGNVLEVFDSTGGGDTNYIPGAFNALNFEGYIWIPADAATADSAWSTGVGIATRNEGTWFSGFTANAMENGFYLEYENGPVTGVTSYKAVPAVTTAGARFFAYTSAPTLNTAAVTASGQYNELGSITAGFNKGAWNSFKLIFDVPNNRLFASLNGTSIYNGAIPAGTYNTSGGVVAGFRESHTGTPAAGEGTWIDGVVLNTNTVVTAVNDWSMY